MFRFILLAFRFGKIRPAELSLHRSRFSGVPCNSSLGTKLPLIAACAAMLFIHPAHAQLSGSAPIHLTIQFAAGGGSDAIARILSQELPSVLGRPIVVENRPGANGAIANQVVANAAPDGLTLLLGAAGAMVITPHIFGKASADTMKDLVPIALFSRTEFVLVVNGKLPVKNLRELTALARAKPGMLNFASAGNGSAPHLAGELYKKLAGIDIVHVPYKGLGPAFADLISGQTQIMFTGIGLVSGFLKSGQLRVLASTGKTRSALTPDLPSLDEAGLTGYYSDTWYGIHGPANLPPAIVTQINAAVRTVLARPAVRERILAAGGEPAVDMTPAQFAAFQLSEYERWGKLIREAGIKGD